MNFVFKLQPLKYYNTNFSKILCQIELFTYEHRIDNATDETHWGLTESNHRLLILYEVLAKKISLKSQSNSQQNTISSGLNAISFNLYFFVEFGSENFKWLPL